LFPVQKPTKLGKDDIKLEAIKQLHLMASLNGKS